MVVEWEHFVAGTCGGFSSTLILHPLDLLKIRFAVNEGGTTHRPQYRSYWQAAKTIVRESGRISSLYQGVTPNLVGSTTAWGAYFFLYNAFKDTFSQQLHLTELSARHSLAAGFCAGKLLCALVEVSIQDLSSQDLNVLCLGSLTLLLTNPIWVAKTRLCLQYERETRQYRSFGHCLWTILRKEGLRGWYKGFAPGLLGTSHGALQFMAYDELKRRWSGKLQYLGALDSAIEHLTFAALSKMFAVASTYPYQVVRARLQDHHARYSGVKDVIQKTMRHEGLGGFYKGLGASLVRVLPATCITFLVYEEIIAYLRDKKRPIQNDVSPS